MRVFNRPFDELQKDFQKMLAFLIDDYADKQDHYVWSATRLGGWVSSLASGYGHFFQSCMRDNTQLWFNNIEELVGFAISENGNAAFYVLVKRGHEFLYGEIIEWVKANWNNKKGVLNTVVDESHHILMHSLEKAGFKKGNVEEVSRQYDLPNMDLSVPILPKGIVIKDMFTSPNEYGIRLLRNHAFGGRNEVSDFDIARQRASNESPFYFPHLDIYAQSHDDVVVSGCVGLVDFKNNYAEIEVVCTHTLAVPVKPQLIYMENSNLQFVETGLALHYKFKIKHKRKILRKKNKIPKYSKAAKNFGGCFLSKTFSTTLEIA